MNYAVLDHIHTGEIPPQVSEIMEDLCRRNKIAYEKVNTNYPFSMLTLNKYLSKDEIKTLLEFAEEADSVLKKYTDGEGDKEIERLEETYNIPGIYKKIENAYDIWKGEIKTIEEDLQKQYNFIIELHGGPSAGRLKVMMADNLHEDIKNIIFASGLEFSPVGPGGDIGIEFMFSCAEHPLGEIPVHDEKGDELPSFEPPKLFDRESEFYFKKDLKSLEGLLIRLKKL